MNIGEPLRIAMDIVNLFEKMGINYMIGGSMASSLFGIPRSTQDVDFIVSLEDCQIGPLCSELEGFFYYSESTIRDAVYRSASFNIIHLETMFKADVFVAGKASPEDLIIEKLVWYEKGNRISERQLKDVEGVIKIQKHKLDLYYLKTQATKRNISELLNQLLAE
ncbi:hypothetical protein K8T06_10900 [bacterium]|nr:hypothetical protein [bacterium]